MLSHFLFEGQDNCSRAAPAGVLCHPCCELCQCPILPSALHWPSPHVQFSAAFLPCHVRTLTFPVGTPVAVVHQLWPAGCARVSIRESILAALPSPAHPLQPHSSSGAVPAYLGTLPLTVHITHLPLLSLSSSSWSLTLFHPY